MTYLDLVKEIANTKKPTALVDMPVTISIGKSDADAAKLLMWMFENMPDATSGEYHDALAAAQWWLTLFDTMNYADKNMLKGE